MNRIELKKLILECACEMGLDTPLSEDMARIAGGLKLADDWEEKLARQPESIRKSVRYTRIIDYLKENETGTIKDIALDKFKSNDPAAANMQVKYLKEVGIIKDTGLVTPKQEKEPTSGIAGRPKLTDEASKEVGISVIRKYTKGQTDFTADEKTWIAGLYKASQG